MGISSSLSLGPAVRGRWLVPEGGGGAIGGGGLCSQSPDRVLAKFAHIFQDYDILLRVAAQFVASMLALGSCFKLMVVVLIEMFESSLVALEGVF
jgi:hypothetical protein